ncbi:hypothetical protein DY000_02031388 [Brassica cretica]|uniref:Uncharacterized protein n=1 Tax=Brassica cretica TaxID=69181 RepID=A0ABQ7DM84_BRACR|nr:hypothetical protein DY000_02031388 [Brassica cretica]
MLRNEDFLDVDCNIVEVMILSFKSCESLVFSNLFQRDCPSVLLEDKQNDPNTCLKSLHPVIDTPKDFLDVDCNIAEVMILSSKSCESLLFSNLFQRDCPFVLLEDKQKELHRRVRYIAMDGDLPPSYARFTEEWSVCLERGNCREEEHKLDEITFSQDLMREDFSQRLEDVVETTHTIRRIQQGCIGHLQKRMHVHEVDKEIMKNQGTIGDVAIRNFVECMPILLRSSQSASREEAVEKRNVCRSCRTLDIDKDARMQAEPIL